MKNAKYLEWMSRVLEDPDLTAELEAVKDDEDGLYDRFYRDLEFGTGGLRGVIGAGTNRMNIYTVRKATQRWPGSAQQMASRPGSTPS